MHPGATRALVFAALALVACDEPDGPCGGHGNDDLSPPCETAGRDTLYVLDQIQLPTTPELAAQFALNLDGDEQNVRDNRLERILFNLTNAFDLDPQAATDEAIETGTVVYLNRIKATALTTAVGVALWWYLGEPDDGTGYTVDPVSPVDAKVMGQIVGGQFTGGPGRMTIGITFGPDQTLLLDLIGARVSGGVTEEGIGTDDAPALLGGAVLRDDLIERLGGYFQQMMAADCDADCNCVVRSKGEVVRDLFDLDPDCTLTLAELEQNDFMTEMATPDVDLVDANGVFNPRDDRVLDAISIGLAFTSVGATFTVPPDP